MEVKNQCLMTFNLKGDTYSVRISEHGALRCNQRNVDTNNIMSAIFALKVEKIKQARDNEKDLAVIDEDNDFAVILGMNRNTIHIVTVIDKSDIWVKEGTEVFKL